jgi:tRNA threonylcarbamoyladenosine biosynthesis protein TsaB
MLVAALDTSTLTLSCALCEISGGAVERLCDRTERPTARPAPGAPPSGHGTRVPEALSDLLVAVDRRIADVEGYAIGLGPGSFTGLRVGLATWKGLAYANRRPIAGASSLAAMALEAAAAAGEGTLLVPLLDAKKGEVYAGFYRVEAGGGAVTALRPDAALGPEALLEAVAALPRELEPLGFGEGYAPFAGALGPRLTEWRTEIRTPPAGAVGRLAAAALRGGAFDKDRLAALEPHYVRLSEAEVKFPHGLPPSRP